MADSPGMPSNSAQEQAQSANGLALGAKVKTQKERKSLGGCILSAFQLKKKQRKLPS